MERRSAAAPHTVARAGAIRTAVIWEVLQRELDRARLIRPTLNIVDVGGGTGGFAVPLAQAGHQVTVVDASPDALAALSRRAEEAGVANRVTAVQGDADALADLVPSVLPTAGVDLVLCHSVLEVVDSPTAVAAALHDIMREGAAASVLVANRAAAALTRAIAGQLDQAMALLSSREGCLDGTDTVRRRFDIETATTLLAHAGLTVEDVHGVRVVSDVIPGVVAERDHEALAAFEWAVATRAPFRDIATQLHLLARKP